MSRLESIDDKEEDKVRAASFVQARTPSRLRRSTSPPIEMASSSSTTSLLGSFRKAVKKVRFLLSFSATRWILSSIVGSRGAAPRRRVSFGPAARPPSLLDYEGSVIVSPPARSEAPSRTASLGPSPKRTVSRTSSAASSELLRTSSAGSSSSPSGGDDDIDRRAELFIANFYKHIQMERQVSLQLRYLDRTPSR